MAAMNEESPSDPINGSENDHHISQQLTYHPEDDASALLTQLIEEVRGNRISNHGTIKDVGKRSTTLQQVGLVIDDVLEVLEKFGPAMLRKLKSQTEQRVGAVREITRFIKLANEFGIYEYLNVLLTFMDVEEDAYSAERLHITQLLADVDSHIEEIKGNVEAAGDILKTMAVNGVVYETSLRELDRVINDALSKVRFGGEMLDEAERVINVLVRKAETAKWLSRGIRFALIGFSSLCWYKLCKRNEVDSLTAVGGGAASAAILLCIFPKNTLNLLDSVKVLQLKHRRLGLKLQDQQRKIDAMH